MLKNKEKADKRKIEVMLKIMKITEINADKVENISVFV